jgi:hypothetical protein
MSFTIHDREDSADLINLVRHDLGFSKTEERVPQAAKSVSQALMPDSVHQQRVDADAEVEAESVCAYDATLTLPKALSRHRLVG